MEWTEDAITRLRALWAEGHSTAEIGRRMGISKNAVVGKAHRLELPPRPSPIRREGQTPRAPRRAATRRINGPTLPSLAGTLLLRSGTTVAQQSGRSGSADGPPAVSAPVQGVTASLLRPDADHPAMQPVPEVRQPMRPVTVSRSSSRLLTCCWPIGEPGTPTFRFCDDGALTGKPYCGEHAALAYVKVRDRREEAA